MPMSPVVRPQCSAFQPGVYRMLRRGVSLALAALALALLAACGSSKGPSGSGATPPGTYRVVKGDTLTQIARRQAQSVQSLIRMNNLLKPSVILVGQMLKVQGGATAAAPSAGCGTAVPRAPVKGASVAAPRSINQVWPAEGSMRRGTTSATSQGVYIAGTEVSPVKAA